MDLSLGLSLGSATVATASAYAPHKYWRIYIDENQGGTYCGLDGVELQDGVGTNLVPDTTGASASSQVNAANAPTYAFDETQNANQWLSQAATVDEWLQYEFTTAQDVRILQIIATTNVAEQNFYPKNFRVQHSDNGVDYTDILTVTNESAWSSGELRTYNL